MQATTVTLLCPNPNCKYPNSETHRFCQQCRTPLVKQYLWVEGQGIENYHVGDLLLNRFLVKSSKVLLDTRPEQSIEAQIFDPASVQPYLKLFPYCPHIPQPYCVLYLEEKQSHQEFLLLDQAPIGKCDLSTEENLELSHRYAQPLELAWKDASALRQINWLWQIAQLWQPLAEQEVSSSLLQPNLIRVEGSLVRLLELRQNQEVTPSLAELGQMWQQLLPTANNAIKSAVSWLCLQMVEKQIQRIDQLINILDEFLQQSAIAHKFTFTVAAQTDQGPTRQSNEDTYYFTDKETFSKLPLTIVCDGMGGHAGGEVASSVAVEAIAQHLQAVNVASENTTSLVIKLHEGIYKANDLINESNNQDHRRDYQRMGTTIVMALACPPKMYIANVGDSRAYLINRSGCYQVTTDDNMGCRLVRLGMSFYRDSFSHSNSAQLIQALGVSSSKVLHPRIRQFVIDEDCIFLLCSDGLSDNNRVEEYWETEILPVLAGEIDLTVASRRLIDLANHRNGHDNVTVSLVYCQVS